MDAEYSALHPPDFYHNKSAQNDQVLSQEEPQFRKVKYKSTKLPSLKFLISEKNIENLSKLKNFADYVDCRTTGSWKRHHIIVENKIINLYKAITIIQPHISINFDTVSCEVHVLDNSFIEIHPLEFNKSLFIRPLTNEKLEDLCISIYFWLVRSIGYNVKLTSLSRHSKKFWRRYYISCSV